MKNENSMKNKIVFITGASSGIGFQAAKDFLLEGAFVGAHYCGNATGIKKLREYSKDGRLKLFQADFCDSSEVKRVWNDFINWSKGKIDILVNNAGAVTGPMTLEKIDEETWDRTFQINVKAPFILSSAAFSIMSKQNKGRIINISSIGVKFGGSPVTAHYSASKAALEAITKSFAKAGAPYNILVNAVRPGVTDTPLHIKTGRKNLLKRVSLIPLRRLGRPSEISNVVLFLASDRSSFMTNTVIDVAGGE